MKHISNKLQAEKNKVNIFGINVDKLNYESFLNCFKATIEANKKISICYANADTLNKIYKNENLKTIFNSFDIIHPDGIGVYKASRYLYGNYGLEKRITGSDFYDLLIKESISNMWSYFFFGHTDQILNEIKKNNTLLNIKGCHEGYNYSDEEVIRKINNSDPDILIIGLSCPKQEEWIYENKDRLKYKVILTVGEGIKVFAHKKIRGPLFMRKAGLEWLVRLITNPVSNFRRYVTGIPLFGLRILGQKLKAN